MGDSNTHDIAVIGMTGRYPKSRNLDEFWENLRNGVELITFLSDEELEAEGVAPSVYNNPNYVKSAGGVLEDIEMFDASFFDYTPREADSMDPQHRIFLECAWEVLACPERSRGTPFPSILLGVVSLSNHGSEPEVQPFG